METKEVDTGCLNITVKQDLIHILQETLAALKQQNTKLLREVSNHITHCASIFQNSEAIKTAIVIYALFKIQDRGIVINDGITDLLQEGLVQVKNDNNKSYLNTLENIFKKISKLDEKLDLYMQQVINEAKIKKGMKLYQHGISLAQTAELAGTTLWDLMDYMGKTKLNENVKDNVDVKRRLNYARELFQ